MVVKGSIPATHTKRERERGREGERGREREKEGEEREETESLRSAHPHVDVSYTWTLGEHVALVLQMTSPSRQDPSITIFEACYDSVPNLDLLRLALAVFVCA